MRGDPLGGVRRRHHRRRRSDVIALSHDAKRRRRHGRRRLRLVATHQRRVHEIAHRGALSVLRVVEHLQHAHRVPPRLGVEVVIHHPILAHHRVHGPARLGVTHAIEHATGGGVEQVRAHGGLLRRRVGGRGGDKDDVRAEVLEQRGPISEHAHPRVDHLVGGFRGVSDDISHFGGKFRRPRVRPRRRTPRQTPRAKTRTREPPPGFDPPCRRTSASDPRTRRASPLPCPGRRALWPRTRPPAASRSVRGDPRRRRRSEAEARAPPRTAARRRTPPRPCTDPRPPRVSSRSRSRRRRRRRRPSTCRGSARVRRRASVRPRVATRKSPSTRTPTRAPPRDPIPRRGTAATARDRRRCAGTRARRSARGR